MSSIISPYPEFCHKEKEDKKYCLTFKQWPSVTIVPVLICSFPRFVLFPKNSSRSVLPCTIPSPPPAQQKDLCLVSSLYYWWFNYSFFTVSLQTTLLHKIWQPRTQHSHLKPSGMGLVRYRTKPLKPKSKLEWPMPSTVHVIWQTKPLEGR